MGFSQICTLPQNPIIGWDMICLNPAKGAQKKHLYGFYFTGFYNEDEDESKEAWKGDSLNKLYHLFRQQEKEIVSNFKGKYIFFFR